jgi:beta-1,4-mannosyl-glycoprotein beta-1,4-N-acetylglucosaminyltransferase
MKVIDCFIFYNELDMLNFRLKELNDCVDYFVLVECVKTHQYNDKELYFENNKDKFAEYLHKIIHVIVKDNIPTTGITWDIENYQRNCIDIGIKQLNLNSDDIIIISDLDEIPDSNTINNLKKTNFNGIYALEQDFYFYNLNTKYKNKWIAVKIFNYGNYNETPQSYRINNNYPVIKNGGWHFSYFGDVKFIKNKISNFAHYEFNNNYMLNDDRILNQIKNNKDLYGRLEHVFEFIDIKDIKYLPNNYVDLLKFSFNKSSQFF